MLKFACASVCFLFCTNVIVQDFLNDFVRVNVPGRSDNLDEASCFSPLNPKESNTEVSGQSSICWASSESTKAQKVSRYNLRQSLAWDSAFFTNEGVLNCEELSFVNTTFKRSELHLAEIQEEDQRPSESSIATESESCALKNLEVDLFEQMRTSKETHGDGITQDSDVPSMLNVRTSCPIKETNGFDRKYDSSSLLKQRQTWMLIPK
ncbi:hypothetical protein EJ110_NYTH13453 [Nymphaea thermarum]|nr:hypothetical protein EJ110_NYTH13453 [Nymphaea thermarum]